MTGLECREACSGDREALAGLWRQVFGDDEAFIRRVLEDFAGAVYVAAPPGGPPEAMLTAAPCRLGGREGVYLYALGTHPARRGQGLMTELMRLAEGRAAEEGAVFAALIPASAAMFGYYRKRGYTVDAPLRHQWLEAGGPAAAPERAPLTAESLAAARRAWLKVPCVEFSPARMGFIAEDLAEAADLALAPGGYAVYLRGEGEELLAPELAAANDEAARALLRGLLARTGRARARLSLPAESPLLPGGTLRPAALMKPLGREWPGGPAPYLRFALDAPKDSFAMWDE